MILILGFLAPKMDLEYWRAFYLLRRPAGPVQMTNVTKLAEFNAGSMVLGPVEGMYGGAGFKASFKPAAQVALPPMRIPWKVEASRYNGGAPGAKLALSVGGGESDVEAFVQRVDKMALEHIRTNAKKYFPTKKKVTVEDLFNPALKESSDGSFDPVFRPKLTVGEENGSDVITTPLFNMQDKEVLDPNVMLDKGALVTAVVVPSHVYAINNTAGVTWKVTRAGLEWFAEPTSSTPAFDFGE